MALLHKLHSSENQSQPACLESVAVWLGKLALLPVTAFNLLFFYWSVTPSLNRIEHISRFLFFPPSSKEAGVVKLSGHYGKM